MRILVTGNAGYVGTVLTKHLRTVMKDAHLTGFDTGFFAHCLSANTMLPECLLDRQVFGDVRALPDFLLDSVDAVVHLAAVSNDPMGSRFEKVTDQINHLASVDIAKRAFARGVKKFVFASSCSVYGFADSGPRSEDAPLNPLTAYAKSKVATEQSLGQLDLGRTTVTSLRFATACGWSDRIRLDLVLNDFVTAALTTGKITVLSDGTPWRPLIDVRDMARAIEWALIRNPSESGQCVTVNAGSDTWNYQVRDLAYAVAGHVPEATVSINEAAVPDKRSYRVDFSLYERLAPHHQPRVSLSQAIIELIRGLRELQAGGKSFDTSEYVRLRALERHIAESRLSDDLRWLPA